MKADMVIMTVRLPADIHSWLKAESEHTTASVNSEIVRALRKVLPGMERRDTTRQSEAA